MTPAVRARATEPFFTTKSAGQGSGLGLSMVYGFAAQSGGRLEIESEAGQGSRVTICLPQSAHCAAEPAAPAPEAALPPGLKVLLVEDDALVRGQVERRLAALGCVVQACADGYDALDALAMGGGVDVLMTDINMPGGLNGRQLAEHARLLDPRLRILFTSGHTDDPILRTVRYDPCAAFLAKPYRRAELSRKLADLVAD
jgi:CheY-like chemotaxis protein